MPNVYLGVSGSERGLEHISAIGRLPSWPVTTKKEAKKAKMSDGSDRWAFFGTKKVFKLAWGFLSSSQLAVVKTLNELNQILRYKNEHEEDVWYTVVISDFSHEPARMDIRGLERYKVSMTLEETDSSLRV